MWKHFCFVFYVFVLFQAIYPVVNGYTCSTPKKWLDKIKKRSHLLKPGKGGLWPEGLVKYKFNSSLTVQDRHVLYEAFYEYHNKTCIQFRPKLEEDINYISIERDDNVCGMAQVCMQGGYQFIKFGQNCGNKQNLIHQLGHALCLPHEKEGGYKGDKLLFSNEICYQDYSTERGPFAKRLYDKASQMHVGCSSEKKCGFLVTSGLSRLDVDFINAMYQCQGCSRHRWTSPESLRSNSDKKHLYHFGFLDADGSGLYPCRGVIKGAVIVGKYKASEEACYVGVSGKEYKLCENFEVFTIPGGLRVWGAEYLLVEANMGLSSGIQATAIFQNAITAGHLPLSDRSQSYSNVYIAFGAVPNFQRSCMSDTVWWKGGSNRKVDVIGRAWRDHQNGLQAYAAFCLFGFPLRIFYVLTCEELKVNRIVWNPNESLTTLYKLLNDTKASD